MPAQKFVPTLMSQSQAAAHERARLIEQLFEEEHIAKVPHQEATDWSFRQLRKRINSLRCMNRRNIPTSDFGSHTEPITLGQWLASK